MSNVSFEQQQRWLAAEARPDDAILRRYRQAQLRASVAALVARALGRSTGLLTLSELLAGRSLRGARAAGLRSVPIAAIVASEGRAGDFDARFRPLRAETWDRWRSVALAQLRGDALPPVELIAVDGHFAVRDGHHRISVAASLGQREVDALVTVLEA
jgi:hypothetical protein